MNWAPKIFSLYPNAPRVEFTDTEDYLAMPREELELRIVEQIQDRDKWQRPGVYDLDMADTGQLRRCTQLPLDHSVTGPGKLRIKTDLFVVNDARNHERVLKTESIDLEQARKTGLIIVRAMEISPDGRLFGGSATCGTVVSIEGVLPTVETIDSFDLLRVIEFYTPPSWEKIAEV